MCGHPVHLITASPRRCLRLMLVDHVPVSSLKCASYHIGFAIYLHIDSEFVEFFVKSLCVSYMNIFIILRDLI